MKSSKSVVSTPTRQLSEYVANALKKPLPREVEARAKLHLIDTFAAMISGSRLVPGAQAQRYVSKITAASPMLWFGNTLVSIVVRSTEGADQLCAIEHWMPFGDSPPRHRWPR